MTTDVKMGILESVRERRRVAVFDMKHLRKVLVVGGMERTNDENIRESFRNKTSLLERKKQSTLTWFGHMERMNEGRLAKNRLRRRLGNGVQELLEQKGFSFGEYKRMARNWSDWKIIVYGVETWRVSKKWSRL